MRPIARPNHLNATLWGSRFMISIVPAITPKNAVPRLERFNHLMVLSILPVKSTAQMSAALLKNLPRHEQLELLSFD